MKNGSRPIAVWLFSFFLCDCSRIEHPHGNSTHRRLSSLYSGHHYDQKLTVYFSNPRAASLFLTDRLQKFGTGRFDFIPKIEEGTSRTPSARWMMSLFPKKLYLTSRGQSMNRFVAFLMPISMALRKIDGFEELWKTTHDERVLPMIVADELCEPLFTNEINSRYGGWHGPILRNYWDDSQMETQKNKNHQNKLKYLPLGARFEFPIILEEEIKAVDDRKYLFNMMVSLDTDPARQVLENKLLNEISKLREMSSSSPSLSFKSTLPSIAESYIHNSKEWKSTIPITIEQNQLVPTTSYRDVLLNSIFTLCPSGHNPETFRIFEASESGSIPIVDFTLQAGACKNPWKPFIDSNAPFIWIKNWNDIINILKVLRNNPTLILKLQQDVVLWYHKFMKKAVLEVEESVREHLALWLVYQQERKIKEKQTKYHSSSSSSEMTSSLTHHNQPPKDLLNLFQIYRRAGRNKKTGVDPKDAEFLSQFEKQQESMQLRWHNQYEQMVQDKLNIRNSSSSFCS